MAQLNDFSSGDESGFDGEGEIVSRAFVVNDALGA